MFSCIVSLEVEADNDSLELDRRSDFLEREEIVEKELRKTLDEEALNIGIAGGRVGTSASYLSLPGWLRVLILN